MKLPGGRRNVVQNIIRNCAIAHERSVQRNKVHWVDQEKEQPVSLSVLTSLGCKGP